MRGEMAAVFSSSDSSENCELRNNLHKSEPAASEAIFR